MEKKLYRSEDDKLIGGVCGGIAKYLSADPTVVRLITAAGIILTGGTGLLLYGTAWMIMPKEPSKKGSK